MLQKYPFSQVPITYSLSDFTPHIDYQTMDLHYNQVYKNYVDGLNTLIEANPQFKDWTLQDLIIRDINQLPIVPAQRIKNHAGAVYSHEVFFAGLDPSHSMLPFGNLMQSINDSYGSFTDFKTLFIDAARNVTGSGWVWLISEGDQKVHISITGDNRCPAIDILTPILVVDVWEHAFFSQYPEEIDAYVNNWFEVVNWEMAEHRYNGCQKKNCV